ncbi:hypothetical protein NVV78_08120 [Pediococcus ethanolidurans]|uniref:hypothetical protein n=1 Tax=Pediococcus ethanolidurans TaxID=319653 RepID=UPI0021E8940D|nr:hypothetical protein [Pediococcus ethanolidurans]MCV3315905.1 hypothetical protein [Pediococcus ethanolidurans]
MISKTKTLILFFILFGLGGSIFFFHDSEFYARYEVGVQVNRMIKIQDTAQMNKLSTTASTYRFLKELSSDTRVTNVVKYQNKTKRLNYFVISLSDHRMLVHMKNANSVKWKINSIESKF